MVVAFLIADASGLAVTDAGVRKKHTARAANLKRCGIWNGWGLA
jgi:hypothetical protein